MTKIKAKEFVVEVVAYFEGGLAIAQFNTVQAANARHAMELAKDLSAEHCTVHRVFEIVRDFGDAEQCSIEAGLLRDQWDKEIEEMCEAFDE